MSWLINLWCRIAGHDWISRGEDAIGGWYKWACRRCEGTGTFGGRPPGAEEAELKDDGRLILPNSDLAKWYGAILDEMRGRRKR